jgi:activating signal cointegrator 1
LWQPWASLVALGVKTIETRHWTTSYRGPLAIPANNKVASLDEADDAWNGIWHNVDGWTLGDYEATKYPNRDRGALYVLPTGAVIATCNLVAIVPTELLVWVDKGNLKTSWWPIVEDWGIVDPLAAVTGAEVAHVERPYGDYSPGRFAWLLSSVQALDKPVPAKGHQQLWNWDPE